ncbi:MAG: hypothetical protein MUF71_17275 [Candidatus Kapabacteria bacterium]|jgi:tetratricopeptide (TPR) repeat protein|nr:hypothetical protein [Candidatus Kapabacteria bacterium]
MLSIFVQTNASVSDTVLDSASDTLSRVRSIIASVDRLDEVVTVEEISPRMFAESHSESGSSAVALPSLLVDESGIRHTLDWANATPPYLLPDCIALQTETLLACVFARLGNWEQVHALLANQHTELYAEFDVVNRLQNAIPLAPVLKPHHIRFADDTKPEFEQYRQLHNAAITLHYGTYSNADSSDDSERGLNEIVNFYECALQAAPSVAHMAFTTLHYATLLLDVGEPEKADALLQTALQAAFGETAFGETAKFALKSVQNSAWLAQLTVPYDEARLERLKTQLWETLQFYERSGQSLQAALVLVDASQIANYLNSFSESLGYISKAIHILEHEELPELLGTAFYRKGTLLFTWAKQGEGNPQFYKPAMQAYQDTLKIFDRDTAPQLFADVHHHLGVIYSEMPDDPQKRHIWAALSSSSFKEALNFYTKEAYPYQYAMVCTSIGNAFTKYPEGVRTDHYEKAIEYYREALTVRSAKDYPEERALTLLNFLEASWYVSQGTQANEAQNEAQNRAWSEANEAHYQEMLRAADEIPRLTASPHLVQEAEQHRKNLDMLKAAIQNSSSITPL